MVLMCYEAIRIKRAAPLIPPSQGAAFWEQGRPRNLEIGCQKLYGSNKQKVEVRLPFALGDGDVQGEETARWDIKLEKLQFTP